ncbi:MAG: 30S ribosomal protein S16, partial [Ignavibacteria bacterium]
KDHAIARYVKKQAARKARKNAPPVEAAPAEEVAPVEAPVEEVSNSTEDTPAAEPSAEQAEG